MKDRVLLQPSEPDWTDLLETEARLEAEIAAAEEEARSRVAAARAAAAAAVPDPQALAALSAACEQAAGEQQHDELARIAADADAVVRALQGAPGPLIDALAQRALDALLCDALAAQRR